MELVMSNGKTLLDGFEPSRWWGWARKHPGTLLLGAVVLAALLAPPAWARQQPVADTDADETPLFI
jgi:hypothetical protein